MYDNTKSIQLIPGNLFDNKTKKYLVPSLNLYNDNLKSKLNENACLAIACGDHYYSVKEDNNLYFVFDKNGVFENGKYASIVHYRDALKSLIDYVEEKEYFVDLYNFKKNNNFIVLVLKLPEELSNIKEKFLNGKFSTLYTKKQIDKIINPKIFTDGIEEINPVRRVLMGDSSFKPTFINQIKKDFGKELTITLEDIDELDYTPIKKQEYLFYLK